MNEFDLIAKKLWFDRDDMVVQLVDGMMDRDRVHLEQRLFALYGAKVHLFGTIAEMRASLAKAKAEDNIRQRH